jgi:4-amino-4-deoxy-L-arabinose transferase-like glycosyltransferase
MLLLLSLLWLLLAWSKIQNPNWAREVLAFVYFGRRRSLPQQQQQ